MQIIAEGCNPNRPAAATCMVTMLEMAGIGRAEARHDGSGYVMLSTAEPYPLTVYV